MNRTDHLLPMWTDHKLPTWKRLYLDKNPRRTVVCIMELSHSLLTFIFANVAVVLSSFVQTATGIGFALIAAPLLALINITFVPGPMLFVNLFLSLIMLGDGRSHVVKKEIAILCPTILIGTFFGVVILTTISVEKLGILVALLILVAVAMTIFAKAQPLTSRNLAACGIAAGGMGSTAGVAGAPLVILYQKEKMEKIRPTMAIVFTFSYITSLIALAFGGAFDLQLAFDGLLLLPGLVIGFFFGKWGRSYMTQAMGRAFMLSIASIGAVLLLLKSVFS